MRTNNSATTIRAQPPYITTGRREPQHLPIQGDAKLAQKLATNETRESYATHALRSLALELHVAVSAVLFVTTLLESSVTE